ncbi:4'-phosphopantetheinyl transferase superfamily protein [Bacillus sp. C1-1]|nr:4'-phosphopantetheinyl transferase superfamily protein [Bacillus sp. C1-1]
MVFKNIKIHLINLNLSKKMITSEICFRKLPLLVFFINTEEHISDLRRNSFMDDMVKRIVAQNFGVKSNEVNVYKTKEGKKYLNENLGIYYSVSYSADLILLGISSSEIGVDLEKIRPIDYNAISSYFSLKEREHLDLMSPGLALIEFFRIWTAKESYLKYIGIGLNHGLNNFSMLQERRVTSFIFGDDYFVSIYI